MAEYLEPNNLNINQNEAKTFFQLKSKMVDVKANFPSGLNYNIDCTLCGHEGSKRKDTQKHMIICPVLTRKNPNIEDIKYRYIKSDIIKEQIKVVRYFKENNNIRKQLVKDLNRSY